MDEALSKPVTLTAATSVASPVRWGQVGAFLGLTFGLTYAYNLLQFLSIGYGAKPATGLVLQGMMLIPAWSALLLQVFVFRDNVVHFRKPYSWARVFAYVYLVFGLVFLVGAIVAELSSDPALIAGIGGVSRFLFLGGLIFIIVLQFVAPKADRLSAHLAFGAAKWWALFALLLIALYGAMTALNYVFGLGQAVDAKAAIAQIAAAAGQKATGIENMPIAAFLISTGLQTALLSPFIAMMISVGEEYGWRGTLQPELMKLGRIKGVALVGLIWGVWHAPIIAMGHNYPGHPVAGIFLMTLYTLGLGFILGLAFIKSRSVWVAAYLHGVNNQVLAFLMMFIYKPNDPIWSFGVGIFGVALLLAVVGLLLLDPSWRESEAPLLA
jgi:uncharacterized protein